MRALTFVYFCICTHGPEQKCHPASVIGRNNLCRHRNFFGTAEIRIRESGFMGRDYFVNVGLTNARILMI